MATSTFIQTSGAAACSVAVACSGRSLNVGAKGSVNAEVGGTPDIGLINCSLDTSGANLILWSIACVVPASVNRIDAQTIAVNWRQASQTGGLPTLKEIHLCRLDSGCTNLGSLGSVTGLSTVLSSTGAFSQNLTVGSSQVVAPGDVLLFDFVCSNGTGMSTWDLGLGFNPETSISIDFSNVTTGKVGALPMMGVG